MGQKQLPKMEDVKDEALTTAAKNFKKAVKDRQRKNVILIQTRTILLDLMKSKKLETYRDPEEEIIVTLEPGKEILSVKTPEDEKESDNEAA